MSTNKLGIGSKINHPSFGLGVICNLDKDFYRVYFTNSDSLKSIDRNYEGIEVVEKQKIEANPIEINDIKTAMKEVLSEAKNIKKTAPIASKWLKGSLVLKPANDDLQEKSISIQTFFKKIIMIRERLRVLEQNINNHEKLDEADKMNLQQYITRAYGSLTTFNVLFANKEEQFKGFSSKD